jgi:hypothetical protein
MKSVTTGTLVDRVVQLDEQVDLPNHSRVSVRLEPIDHDKKEADKTQTWRAGHA